MPATACPSAPELERLLRGGLTPDASAEVERHLAGCDACVAAVKTLLPADSTLADALGAKDTLDPAAAPPLVLDLIRRLEAARPKAAAGPAAATFAFQCPPCRKKLSIKRALAGRKVKCP